MDLARAVVHRRGWVVAAWLLVAAVFFPASARVESALEVSARIRGSESAEVERVLQTGFASPFGTWACWW